MNLSIDSVRNWMFDKASKTQKTRFLIWFIYLFCFYLLSVFLLRMDSLNNLLLNRFGSIWSINPTGLFFTLSLFVAISNALVVLSVLWYIFSWPLNLIDELASPEDIPDTRNWYYRVRENPPNYKETVGYGIRHLEALSYSLKRAAFYTIGKIFTLFLFIILLFGNIFNALTKYCQDGALDKLGKGGHYLKCVYYSLITFTTVGFGDISPVKENIWAHLATMFESITATAYVLLSFTMVASCIFLQYSARREHFSLFLETMKSSDSPTPSQNEVDVVEGECDNAQ